MSRHSESKLTIENFTYAKELIYREPFEIERSAKQKSIVCNSKTGVSDNKKPTPNSTPKTTTSKNSTPKTSTSKTSTPKTTTPKTLTPKITKFMLKAQPTPVAPVKTVTPKTTPAKKSNAQTTEIETLLSESTTKASGSGNIDHSLTTLSGRQRKRKVPFDNSLLEESNKKMTRRHSSAITVPASELSVEKSSELPSQKEANSKILPSKKPAAVKTPSQVKILPSSKKTKLKKGGFDDADEL